MNNKERLAAQIADETLSALDEWRRRIVVEVDGHPLEGRELSMTMQGLPTNGQADVIVEECGAFRITVKVEPIGPHQDLLADRLANDTSLSEWVPATLKDCLAGDRIRIGQDETTVSRTTMGVWNASTGDAWHPRKWPHVELRMDLEANPGLKEYPTDLACEIFMDPARQAAHILAQSFPGSSYVE